MTSRERVAAALNFEPPDRLPVNDSLWDGLQADWIKEGMPAGVTPADHFGWDIAHQPRTWDALLRPCYERINALLRRHGIRFLMHTDGRMWDLLPRLIEVGVEALNPFECAAGMDIAELRRRYPRQLTCYGNISATGLLGDRSALEAELRRTIPFAAGGGFIMHSDHSIPFGVRYEQYRSACQCAQELFAAAGRAGF